MGFIADIFQSVVDVVVAIVDAVVQVVETVVTAIMVILGYDGGSTQVVEYYEVHNIPLFTDEDLTVTLTSAIQSSIYNETSLISELIFALNFTELKGNIKKFMAFIENGYYFEGFPSIQSHILIIDYSELGDVLDTLNGVPCTNENAYLRALSKSDWVKYWLQENKDYDVGDNLLGTVYREVVTSPVTPAADTVTVTPSTNHFAVEITSAVSTSDDVLADTRWQVNFGTIVYNATPDTYTVQVYNVSGITRTLSYTVPSRPTQLHYVSFYYRNSAPSRTYIFIYQAGSGTYTDLDTVEDPIDQQGLNIQSMNPIPLRISNTDFTSFGATKAQQIDDLAFKVNIDAEALLDRIMSDPGSQPGDVDHIYINFGVRMWDTSQPGMGYLFQMFENIYPSQSVTKGVYDNTPAGDEKPANNIITETDDGRWIFRWAYITYEHTSLTDINANSGSVQNGIYYSDMSRFTSNNILYNNYYVSSGKGLYNVGYKASTLSEVQDFLDGNGVVNPGTTTGEATNWLQVTERLSYNNPTPNLLEADNSASDLKYVQPDLIYENNGSGTLRLVNQASEETTHGQSITYYCCKASGLDAYTVTAPIAVCKVIDGDTGHFRMVKFNLGNKYDLMMPFVYTNIKDLSHREITTLFMRGAHASIYIAHYEIINHPGMSLWAALVIIVVVVVIIVYAPGSIGKAWKALTATGKILAKAAAAGIMKLAVAVAGIITKAVIHIVMTMAVQYMVQAIVVAVTGDEELAMILGMLAGMAAGMTDWTPGIPTGVEPGGVFSGVPAGTQTIGAAAGTNFTQAGYFVSNPTVHAGSFAAWSIQTPVFMGAFSPSTILHTGFKAATALIETQTKDIYHEIENIHQKLDHILEKTGNLLKEYTDILDGLEKPIDVVQRIITQPTVTAEQSFIVMDNLFDLDKIQFNITARIDASLSPKLVS